MVKSIENFSKVYGEKIYPANGMMYMIEKSNLSSSGNDPQLLYYFDVKLFDMYANNNHKPAEYSIAIFADTKNSMNIASVYKRGDSGPVFVDKGMSSTHFKNKEYFKTYVVTLINRAL